MRSFLTLISFFTLTVLASCAAGPGRGPDEATGAASLSLRLAGLEEGEIYVSNDGYVLSFTHFAIAFSGMSIGEAGLEENFSADVFAAEAPDLVAIDVPAGEYGEIELVLGLGGAGGDPAELDGHSVFLEAEASDGMQSCVLRVLLDADEEAVSVDPGDQDVDVAAGEEIEVLVEVDPNRVFSGIDLAGRCQGGGILDISADENGDIAASLAANFLEAFALGDAGGHHH